MMESESTNGAVVKNNRRQLRQAGLPPAAAPWDMEALSRPPAFEWGEDGQVRSLFYEGEPYRGIH